MKITLAKISLYVLLAASVFLFKNSKSGESEESAYSPYKLFVKTKTELKFSEATGQISVITGMESFDKKNIDFKVRKIKQVFKLNNGDRSVYEELQMNRMYVLYLDTNAKADITGIVSEYANDGNVEFAEPVFIGYGAGQKDLEIDKIFLKNYLTPNDEHFSKQWYLKNTGNIPPSSNNKAKVGGDINMVKAWEIETGSDDVIVAVLDSGVRLDHPEFKGRIWKNAKEIPNNGIDDDGNGYIDDVSGWDFAYETNSPKDGFGHGTNIATVIGANTNNTIGFAGINWKCKIMVCKNLSDDNSGEYEWWAESIKYAVDNGAKIINMSEGGQEDSKVLRAAIQYAVKKKVLVVAAMMNKANGKNYYPACIEGVMAVGATDSDDKRAEVFSWGGGSCWGNHIAVVAPGNKIYGCDFEDVNNYNSTWSGTSQSTAVVSGIASLLLAQDKSRTPEQLRKIICETAIDGVGNNSEDKKGWDKYYGWGRVDAYRALSYERGNNNNRVENDNDNYQSGKKVDKDAGKARKVDEKPK